MRKRFVLIMAVVATIGCDRVTKRFAEITLEGTPGRSFLSDTVRLEYAENVGGFLSLGAQLPPAARIGVFTVGTGLALLALVGVARRASWSGWRLVGLTVFVAGGASNWVDRVLQGRVVDFLNVGFGPLRTGTFNVADMAIVLGLGIMVAGFRRHHAN